MTADTYEGEDNKPDTLHKYMYVGADPINRIDPSGHGDSVMGSALLSMVRRSTALAVAHAAKYAVRLTGCAAASAVMLYCMQAIINNGLPFIKLPYGAGVNVAVGFGAEEIGHEVVDGPLPWVVGIYARSITPAIERTIEELEAGGYKVVVSSIQHAEIIVKNTIEATGRVVGGVITLWRLCPSCAEVFRYTGETLGRGLGNCVELIP